VVAFVHTWLAKHANLRVSTQKTSINWSPNQAWLIRCSNIIPKCVSHSLSAQSAVGALRLSGSRMHRRANSVSSLQHYFSFRWFTIDQQFMTNNRFFLNCKNHQMTCLLVNTLHCLALCVRWFGGQYILGRVTVTGIYRATPVRSTQRWGMSNQFIALTSMLFIFRRLKASDFTMKTWNENCRKERIDNLIARSNCRTFTSDLAHALAPSITNRRHQEGILMQLFGGTRKSSTWQTMQTNWEVSVLRSTFSFCGDPALANHNFFNMCITWSPWTIH